MPLVPSTHPQFFLTVPAEPGRQQNVGSDPFKGQSSTVCLVDNGQPLASLPIGDLGKGEGTSWARHDFTIDKRVIYIPQADQVITIPFTNDQLLVSPFNLRNALRAADKSFLFVSSIPPQSCQRGRQLRYSIEVASSADDVTLELSAAPEGMKMTAEGKITWAVSEDLEEELVIVIISISTPDDSVFHTLRLQVK